MQLWIRSKWVSANCVSATYEAKTPCEDDGGHQHDRYLLNTFRAIISGYIHDFCRFPQGLRITTVFPYRGEALRLVGKPECTTHDY